MSGSCEDYRYSTNHTDYKSYSSVEFQYRYICSGGSNYSSISYPFILHGTDAKKMMYFDNFDWKKDKIIIKHTVSLGNFNAILNFVNGNEILRKKYDMKEIINMLDPNEYFGMFRKYNQ